MENYIQKIISVFTASKHSEKVIEEVHQWLVDKEYSDEKEAALHCGGGFDGSCCGVCFRL